MCIKAYGRISVCIKSQEIDLKNTKYNNNSNEKTPKHDGIRNC